MSTRQRLFGLSKIVFLGLVLILGVSYALATHGPTWHPPVSGPPVCNTGDSGCDPPVNVSDVPQWRDGALVIEDILTVNKLGVTPNLATFVPDPTAKLDVDGKIRIRGVGADTPGVGKILTSDANGLASWGDPSAGALWYATTTAPANSIENNKLGGPFGDVFIAKNLRLYPTDSTGAQGAIKLKNGASLMHWRGTNNMFVGPSAGNFTLTGINNSAFGNLSLTTITTGNRNLAVGSAALQNNKTGSDNVALGFASQFTEGFSSGGSFNTSVGSQSLELDRSGSSSSNSNTAVGFRALRYLSDDGGIYNVAVGANALRLVDVASNPVSRNVAVGGNTLLVLDTSSGLSADDNVAVGYNALTALTDGSGNIAIGSGAGSTLTSISNSMSIGRNASAGGKKSVAIGYNAVAGSDNAFILGGTGADEVYVKIGVTPVGVTTARLTVEGDANTPAFQTWTAGGPGDPPISPPPMTFSVLNNGNVGIGTPGTAATDAKLTLRANSGSGNAFSITDFTPNDDNEKLTVANNPSTGGSVGIGSTTPYAKLAVKGYFSGAVNPAFPLFEVQDSVLPQGASLFKIWENGNMRIGVNSSETATSQANVRAILIGNTSTYPALQVRQVDSGPIIFSIGEDSPIANGDQLIKIVGGLHLTPGASQPACTVDTRGTLWFINSGAGIQDLLQVCVKLSTGDYSWKNVSIP